MVLIVAQHVAFGHDVMRLVAPNYRALLQHFNGKEGRIDVATGQQHFTETAAAQHPKKLEIARFQPARPKS